MNVQAKKPQGSRPSRGAPASHVHGYKDRLPAETPYLDRLFEASQRLAQDYGFLRIDTPLLEDARLYAPFKHGPLSAEHLFALQDREENNLVLRPEHVLPFARAYREHNFGILSQPVKLYTIGPYLRWEHKIGSGTYRQFWQFAFSVFGDPQPIVDAQSITALYFLFQELGVEPRLRLNSLGHPQCRAAYEHQLTEFLRTRRSALCDESKAQLARQPLLVLRCAVPACQEATQEAPQLVDHLCGDDREHFARVLEHLDEVEVTYFLEPRLLRDTTLYNRTIAEFVVAPEGKMPYAVAAGGRHDQAVPLVGGDAVAGFGMSLGFDRMLTAMRDCNLAPPAPSGPDVYIAQLGEAARRKSLQLFLQLRHEGIRVAESLSKDSIKAQLEHATHLHAQYALILGQKEIMDGTILIRDMENGIQEVSAFEKVIPEVKKRLAKSVAASLQMPANGAANGKTEPTLSPPPPMPNS